MSLLQHIDIYCERVAPGLWDEPLNALTNIAFFVAAYFLFDDTRRYGVRHREIYALAGLVAIIGAGSSLFHTFANRLTALADVIPIGVFILSYIVLFLMRMYRLPLKRAAVGAVLFITATAGLSGLFAMLDATMVATYVASMMLLWGFAIDLGRRRHPAAKAMAAGALLFSASLTLRSLDPLLCGQLPIGTHFCWHLLNGIVLYILVRLLLRHGGYAQISA